MVEAYIGPVNIDAQIWTRLFIAALLVPLIPIGLIRKLKHLVPLSLIANGCILVGFGITAYYLLRKFEDPGDRYWAPSSIKGVPLFFATAMFAMEGIGAAS